MSIREQSYCVLGGAWLEEDTRAESNFTFGLVDGNDRISETWTDDDDHEDIGYAFKQAMTVDSTE